MNAPTVPHLWSLATNPVAPQAHAVVAAAKAGDGRAKTAILDAVASARANPRDGNAALVADTLSAVAKVQTQAAYVAKWFGPAAGADIAAGHHMSAAHAAAA